MTQVYFTPWEREHAARMAERGRPFDIDAIKADLSLSAEQHEVDIGSMQKEIDGLEASLSQSQSKVQDLEDRNFTLTNSLNAVREALKEAEAAA